jgi:hypothetical protein
MPLGNGGFLVDDMVSQEAPPMKIGSVLCGFLLVSWLAAGQGVTSEESAALMALYSATDGENWNDNEGWGNIGYECTWDRVTCAGSNVITLDLSSNQLSGSIPAEIGSLTKLEWLDLSLNQLSGPIQATIGRLTSLIDLELSSNQLSGPIPAEIGDLASLEWLSLSSNQLSGSIPIEIGSLTSLQNLYLSSNRLSGTIPVEIGSLGSLRWLYLDANRLGGSIPTEIGSLPNLLGIDLRWNALYSDEQIGGDWQSTQTVAPEDLTVSSVSDHTIWIEWTQIIYTGDAGGYEVFSEHVVTTAAASGGSTSIKSDTTFPVTGLQPGESYDLTVRTFTSPHAQNQNLVLSDLTSPVMATTSSIGCSAPVVEVSPGCWTRTLTVSGSYDSIEWSTGETSSSILVSPAQPTYYWVNAIAGSCEEAEVVRVGACLFTDGFESGNTSAWSTTVN